ncbi:hypothetical protein E4T44_02178 [Aureobasidium sp. EXF-8845]|nr:hypothetical protein E4T44_02178 [Aureobasidium sp. EXF-8845]KAI4856384.1 hypothetical protein E4T45_02156 [Aureobasidium sp. EXF-8846]
MCSSTNTDADKATPTKSIGPTKLSKTLSKRALKSSEKLHCICAQKAYGTMIACDNEDCELEWFHIYCVCLGSLPSKSSKWYCPPCRVELGKGVFSYGIVGGNM